MNAPKEVLVYLEKRINANSRTRQEYTEKLLITDIIVRGMNEKYHELKAARETHKAMGVIETATKWLRIVINATPDEKHK